MPGSANTTSGAMGGTEAEFVVQNTNTANDGRPVRAAVLVDPATGLPYAASPLPLAGASTVALLDPTTATQKATVDASGNLHITGVVTVGSTVATQAVGATLLNQASAVQTASGMSATLAVGGDRELLVAVNVSAVAGTTPTLTLAVDTLGADGVWYTLWTSASITAVGQTLASLGVEAAINTAFGTSVRLRWTIGGTTPSFTFSASITGS